ncbi:MAG: hypothetical protein NWQ55_05215 [Salibacteraceae bacterium]|jgi:hypothetical protein|nr:hypothetical protein [Salibacteraceae bacterium]MDP4687189.1 hypothetical protein [Salibacteraceae bacterium]MDP4763344.1 hypothetical protein [Salibacteraceae bacterium]MDP4844278.1 hypothetical protein [Salibacteraceae bacterium]MDP4964449.1 hypothetical protein [Salibacteraceae bacterium]
MKNIIILSIIAISILGCEKMPKACIAVEDTVEAGSEIELTHCSDNYEFITWLFGDSTYGYIGDSPKHIYRSEGKYLLEMEAFSKGAFRSEAASKLITASYRYLDYVEITGNSNFPKFIVRMSGLYFLCPDATGNFTEENPYFGQYFGNATLIPMSQNISLNGFTASEEEVLLLEKRFNLDFVKDNPIFIEENGYTLKIYWKYKTL